ncbi:oligosaccharide biosynthesis protein Alg14 like-domain-containing protein [Terfezia claveryi]|nr:oligosaccharide biosynthesis protein Alg14 like-domain-containing protein [Terfezia claveryi]
MLPTMFNFIIALATLIVLSFLAFLRLLSILPSTNPKPPSTPRPPKSHTHLLAVLGSGGHTSEALLLLSSLNPSKLSYRTYIVSSGDSLSAQKALDFELSRASSPESFTIKEIPRARKIGQSWLSTPASCLRCYLSCLVAVGGRGRGGMVDVVVCNGPGSAVMVVGACLWYKVSLLYSGYAEGEKITDNRV